MAQSILLGYGIRVIKFCEWKNEDMLCASHLSRWFRNVGSQKIYTVPHLHIVDCKDDPYKPLLHHLMWMLAIFLIDWRNSELICFSCIILNWTK
jgi:hypothetical protein